MSLKAHIALGTLLGVLLGAGAVVFLSGTATGADPDAAASGVGGAETFTEDTEALGSNAAYQRPQRPGAERRLLQS